MRGKARAASLFLLAAQACASAGAPPSRPLQRPTSSEADVGTDSESALEIRAAVAPAVQAFNSKDASALRAWIAQANTQPGYKVYGAFLLLQLGADDAKQLFVEHFPAQSAQQFDLLGEIEVALSDSDEPYFGAQKELICGALAGWPRAAAKLLEIRPLADASAHTDNCCGLALLAAAQPNETLALLAAANQGAELAHAFEEEASPATAQQLLTHLEAVAYADAAQERLRTTLIPVLRLKAAATGPKACDWIRCDSR